MNTAELQKLLDEATPGPWSLRTGLENYYCVIHGKGSADIGWPVVCDVAQRKGVSQANARLIAMAHENARKVIVAEKLAEALRWYMEQSHLTRLIHSGGDSARHEIQADAGQKAAEAIDAWEAAQ